MSQPRSRPVFVTPIDLVLQQQTPLSLQKSPINTSNYSYLVKIINPCHKKDVIPRELRKFKGAFQSPTEIRVRLMEELEDLLPATTKFNIGYFCGQSKRWILNAEDIQAMYSSYNPSRDKQLVLWCDGRDDDDNTVTKKRRKVEETCTRSKTKREEKEEVEELAKELMDLHEDKMQLSETQYRLWARLIVNGIHSSKETPPQIPMITGAATPKRQKPTFEETIMNTANAVMKAVSPSPNNATVIHSPVNHIQQVNSTVSPGKAADIRGKSFEQLSSNT